MLRVKRLVLWMGCLFSLIGIWVAIYFQVKHDRNQARKAAETNASNLAKAFEEHVLSTVQQIDSTLLILRDAYQQDPKRFLEQIAIYKKYTHKNLIIQASVIDANGVMVFSELPMPADPLNLSDREHFRVLRDGNGDFLFISKPVIGRISNKWRIMFTRKILRRDGTFGGVMVLSVDPEFYSAFFRTIEFGKHGIVALIGTDRVVRAHTSIGKYRPDIEGQAIPANRPLFDPMKPEAGVYYGLSSTDGINRTWAYRRLQNYPLIVNVGFADDEIYSSANARKKNLFLWGVIVSALLLIGTRLISWLDQRQRQTEGYLREATQRLELATAAGHLGIWDWNVQRDVLVCDNRMLDMYGVAADSFTGDPKKIMQVLHPDDLSDVKEAIKAAVEGGKHLEVEFRIVHPDGAVKMIKANGLVMRNATGEALRMIGLNCDVTDQKRAENALRESEERFRLLVTGIQDYALYMLDPNGMIVSWNEGAERIEGYRAEEIIGRHFACFYPAAEIERGKPGHVLKKAAAQGTHEEEGWHVRKDGSQFWASDVIDALWDDNRQIRGFVKITRDMTGRMLAEQKLQQSEEQFRTLCGSAPIGIFRTDCNGNEVYRNPRLEKITGLTAQESLDKNWSGTIHPDDREETIRLWHETTAAGRLYTHECRVLNSQGEIVWTRALANPIRDLLGNISGYVGTVEDITELRRLNEELLKKQKLESLGVLAGGIAHDFNNILTAILGNLSLARMQMQDAGKLTRRLEETEKATLRAKGLTQQLLTFSRGGKPVKKKIDLGALLKESAVFATHGSNIRCEFLFDDGLWPVEADEGQLSQVIHNLVINAVQAMPDGGTLRVGATNSGLMSGRNNYVEITFTDTGIGIPAQNLPKIFDPYFTTRQKGSGLGLATCHSIIKKHGGSITVTSAQGEGSTFTVRLHASERYDEIGPESQQPAFHGSGRVLVMDDEESVRVIAQSMLEELGYEVECALSASEAVELFRKRKEQGNDFDAVILDLTIPGGTGGKEAINLLRSIDLNVKAVVSSGYSNDPVMANYKEYGFCAVLPKPFSLEEFSTVLQRITEIG